LYQIKKCGLNNAEKNEIDDTIGTYK